MVRDCYGIVFQKELFILNNIQLCIRFNGIEIHGNNAFALMFNNTSLINNSVDYDPGIMTFEKIQTSFYNDGSCVHFINDSLLFMQNNSNQG